MYNSSMTLKDYRLGKFDEGKLTNQITYNFHLNMSYGDFDKIASILI